MNNLIFILITLILLNHCSFNENSNLWKDKKNNKISNKNIIKVFSNDKKIVEEFNKDLKIDLTTIKTNNKIIDNQNNFGPQNYKGELIKTGNFKFSKFENKNQLNFKPYFLNDGIIFFDKKGSILRFGNNQKVVWKKNHYSKPEKKLKPKLSFLKDNQSMLVVDSIAKYYSIDLSTGDLNWSKNNTYPFNSEIKKFKDKMFVVDIKNILRCYNIKDGSECWNFPTENSFTISNAQYSLIISDENVIFSNSIGDITAVNIDTGLIAWQLPTQSSNILNETYNFKISKLVSDGRSIFFSNNRNEFYAIDLKTGINIWENEINSNFTPILVGNLIFTVSNEGYLYVLDKNNGNILKVNDLFMIYNSKKRKNIYPIGFTIGNKNLYITNSDGKILIVGLDLGNIIKIEKVSGGLVSEPFIFNNNLYVVKNGSIVQYN